MARSRVGRRAGAPRANRHSRRVHEPTAMFELKTEHNFSRAPQQILLGSEESLLANMGD